MLGQKGSSRTDTLIKLVLIFFISLLSFSVGTFVGKQFSDSQHKMTALESEYDGGSRETASVPSDSLEIKPDEALTDKDIQKIADEFTKHGEAEESSHPEPIGEHGDTHAGGTNKHSENEARISEHSDENRHVANVEEQTAHSAPNTKHPTHNEAHAPATDRAAQKIAEGKQPSENKPVVKSHMPANLPTGVAASSIGKYTVQISSHQGETEAEAKAVELKAKGFSAFVVPAIVKGKKWYRVSVGLFDSLSKAKSYRIEIMKSAGITSAFVQQIVQ